MEGKKIDFKIVVLVILVSITLFFGGQLLYQKFYINSPLTQELQAVPGVTAVKIEENNGETVVNIALGSVEDLEKSYLEFKKIVKKKETKKVQINILDNPNPLLEELYREMNFSIQEAITKGSFGEMYTRLEDLAREKGLQDWSVSLDQDNIYLQIKEKKNYLYRIIARAGSEQNVERN